MAFEFAVLSFIGLIFFIISAITILTTVFWIWMIIDCAKRDFRKENEKVIWIIIIVLTGIIGALIYYFVIKLDQDKNK